VQLQHDLLLTMSRCKTELPHTCNMGACRPPPRATPRPLRVSHTTSWHLCTAETADGTTLLKDTHRNAHCIAALCCSSALPSPGNQPTGRGGTHTQCHQHSLHVLPNSTVSSCLPPQTPCIQHPPPPQDCTQSTPAYTPRPHLNPRRHHWWNPCLNKSLEQTTTDNL